MSMIHKFSMNGYNIVLDVNGGAVHVVDEVADVYKRQAYIVEYHTPVAYSQLNDILAQILLLVIAIEFVVMLSLHIPGTIIEVLLYAIARKMLLLPKSGGMLEVLLGVIAIAGLFTIRKYLLTKDNSNMNITSIHYDRDDDDIIDAKDPI